MPHIPQYTRGALIGTGILALFATNLHAQSSTELENLRLIAEDGAVYYEASGGIPGELAGQLCFEVNFQVTEVDPQTGLYPRPHPSFAYRFEGSTDGADKEFMETTWQFSDGLLSPLRILRYTPSSGSGRARATIPVATTRGTQVRFPRLPEIDAEFHFAFNTHAQLDLVDPMNGADVALTEEIDVNFPDVWAEYVVHTSGVGDWATLAVHSSGHSLVATTREYYVSANTHDTSVILGDASGLGRAITMEPGIVTVSIPTLSVSGGFVEYGVHVLSGGVPGVQVATASGIVSNEHLGSLYDPLIQSLQTAWTAMNPLLPISYDEDEPLNPFRVYLSAPPQEGGDHDGDGQGGLLYPDDKPPLPPIAIQAGQPDRMCRQAYIVVPNGNPQFLRNCGQCAHTPVMPNLCNQPTDGSLPKRKVFLKHAECLLDPTIETQCRLKAPRVRAFPSWLSDPAVVEGEPYCQRGVVGTGPQQGAWHHAAEPNADEGFEPKKSQAAPAHDGGVGQQPTAQWQRYCCDVRRDVGDSSLISYRPCEDV
jgi:hypothetical protein